MVEEVLFVAKQNRNLVLFYVVGCLVFAAIGVFLICHDDIFYKIVGYFTAGFFGVCCLPMHLKCLLFPITNLILQKNGFYFCSNNFSKLIFVEYDNVSGIELLDISQTKIICFNLKDDSKVVKDFNILQKFIARSNEKSYGYEFSISLSGTGENIEKVYEMMKALIYEKEGEDAKSF